ncbi:MAG: deoxyguanosinetriphosphate triphosphohydrolase [Ignavibacterium sp.]|nr:MAG: deoxyguanosinetriphosphate triphosphohydrolase [Ignavibacterium sp.]
MDWQLLLNDSRLGIDQSSSKDSLDGRSQFQKDFDRVVFSPAFRRLQDKTQVFPLPETDFVHTRLTHSLEVAVVGRSLGNLVGENIIERHPELKKQFNKFHFGDIIAAACLAHDIGNPPFGHSGEDAISEYFKNGGGKEFKDKITDEKKWLDLIKYEGNAQGFRIITALQNPDVKGGLQLTYATIASFTKYPRESFISKKPVQYTNYSVYSKYGFFQAEKEIFKEVAESCRLEFTDKEGSYWWFRHPLAFLMEAADDICYRIMDLEDGFRLGLVSFAEAEELIFPLVDTRNLEGYEKRDEREKIGYLRAKAISDLVNELAKTFLDEEGNILSGKLDNHLISIIPKAEPLKEIMDVSINKIYRARNVVEREVAGYEVLGGLLDTFIHAYNDYLENNYSKRTLAIINLLPKRIITEGNIDLYNRLLTILDFISGMTDSFAVSLFRKIKGISLPEGRVSD